MTATGEIVLAIMLGSFCVTIAYVNVYYRLIKPTRTASGASRRSAAPPPRKVEDIRR